MTHVSVTPDAAALTRPAVLAVNGVTVAERDPRLDEPIAAAERVLRDVPGNDAVVAAVRAMYRRFGVDPTKTRPSSEALLRRLRRGEPLPRINSMVDIGNWCSAETQLPYGLYDLARTRGRIEIRIGRAGEEYPGIRKDVVHVAGRLTVTDEDGPFGNPTSDSARTMVSPATARVLVVIFAPAMLDRRLTRAALALTRERVLQYAGGEVELEAIIPGEDTA